MITKQHYSMDTGQTVNLWQMLAYASPVVATVFILGGVGVIQGIYAKYYGLSLSDIASVLLVCRLFDAISDPVIGYLSDNYFQRKGSYKPFVMVGGLLFALSAWVLYNPPEVVGISFFMTWFLVYYFAWTLFEIPHMAWASKLASDSNKRSLIFSLRAQMTNIGYFAFYGLPLLPFFDSSEITPETLELASVVGIALMVLFLIVCSRVPPSNGSLGGKDKNIENKAVGPTDGFHGSRTIKAQINSVVGNQALLVLLLAYLFSFSGLGMLTTLLFIYVDVYLGLGEQLSIIVLMGIVVGFLAVWYWHWQSQRLGKKMCWALGTLLCALGFVAVSWLRPGCSMWALLFTLLPIYVGTGVAGALIPTLLSEVIDYAKFKFSRDCSASYFSLLTFVGKTNAALGGALAFYLAGLYDFDPTSTKHSEAAVFGLHLAVAWVPSILALLGIVLIFLVPMNNRKHRLILKALDRRHTLARKHRGDAERPSLTTEGLAERPSAFSNPT